MPENISGVSEGRSVFNLTSPFIGLLFRGIHGRLDLDLSGKDKDKAGTVLPTFYSRAGEEVGIPKRFRQSVRAITGAVHCDGCFHCHYVNPPQKEEERVYAAERVTA